MAQAGPPGNSVARAHFGASAPKIELLRGVTCNTLHSQVFWSSSRSTSRSLEHRPVRSAVPSRRRIFGWLRTARASRNARRAANPARPVRGCVADSENSRSSAAQVRKADSQPRRPFIRARRGHSTLFFHSFRLSSRAWTTRPGIASAATTSINASSAITAFSNLGSTETPWIDPYSAVCDACHRLLGCADSVGASCRTMHRRPTGSSATQNSRPVGLCSDDEHPADPGQFAGRDQPNFLAEAWNESVRRSLQLGA